MTDGLDFQKDVDNAIKSHPLASLYFQNIKFMGDILQSLSDDVFRTQNDYHKPEWIVDVFKRSIVTNKVFKTSKDIETEVLKTLPQDVLIYMARLKDSDGMVMIVPSFWLSMIKEKLGLFKILNNSIQTVKLNKHLDDGTTFTFDWRKYNKDIKSSDIKEDRFTSFAEENEALDASEITYNDDLNGSTYEENAHLFENGELLDPILLKDDDRLVIDFNAYKFQMNMKDSID